MSSTLLPTTTTMTASALMRNNSLPDFGLQDLRNRSLLLKRETSPILPPRSAKSSRPAEGISAPPSGKNSLNQACPEDTTSPIDPVTKLTAELPEQLMGIQESSSKFKKYRNFLCSLWIGYTLLPIEYEYIPNIDQLRAIDKLIETIYSKKEVRKVVKERLGWDWERLSNMYVSCALDRTNKLAFA